MIPTIVRDLIPTQICNSLANYIKKDAQTWTEDDLVKGAHSIYAPDYLESYADELTGVLEGHTGCSLNMSYTYARYHKNGASMAKHLDRPSVEFSVTVPLEFDRPWALQFDGHKPASPIVGDGVLFSGADYRHWRDPFQGNTYIIAMFMFVDADGDWKDKVYNGGPMTLDQREIDQLMKRHT